MSETVDMPRIRIRAEVTRQIRQHARSSMTTEVCGVLIGDILRDSGDGIEGATEVTAAIAAVNAAQAGTHVTFTQDAWEHIYKVKDAEYPEARIVGWYHSHPGFGVFLSEHDTFIQENFFSAENQVAWVFDPHSDEEGCFGWAEGRIVRLESITVVDPNAPGRVAESRETVCSEPEETTVPEETEPRSRRRGWPWLTLALSTLLALVVGFTASHFLFPALYPLALPINPASGRPLLRDPASKEPVYMDPQTGRYVVIDRNTGRVSEVDPKTLQLDVGTPPEPTGSLPLPPVQPPSAPKETR